MTEIVGDFTDLVKVKNQAWRGVTQVNGCLCVEEQKRKRQRVNSGESADSCVSSLDTPAAVTVGQVCCFNLDLS